MSTQCRTELWRHILVGILFAQANESMVRTSYQSMPRAPIIYIYTNRILNIELFLPKTLDIRARSHFQRDRVQSVPHVSGILVHAVLYDKQLCSFFLGSNNNKIATVLFYLLTNSVSCPTTLISFV